MAYNNFSYKDRSAQEISAHWLTVTRQSVSIARKKYINDVSMTTKLDEAYKLYRTALLLRKIDSLSVQ